MGTIADIPDIRQLPYDVYFRFAEFPADTYTEPHSHPFGQLNFVSRGTMEIEVASVRYLSPPQYAVWIPPGWKHDARNAAVAAYRSAYISAARSKLLPSRPCTMRSETGRSMYESRRGDERILGVDVVHICIVGGDR